MKKLNLLAVATAFGLSASALAQTKVYISGAPAVRQSATVAIEHLLTANGGTLTRAYNGPNILTANVVTWTGGNIGGTPVTIKLAYTGSAAGYQATAGNINVRFLPDTSGSPAVPLSGGNQTDVNATANLSSPAESHVPDFTFADEYQASTPWLGFNKRASNTYATGGATYNSPQNYEQLADDIVGILPLRIIASPNTNAKFTNLTPQVAQQIYQFEGGFPLSQITGDAADVNKLVYGLGRDIGSGARTLWFADNGLGTGIQVYQYNPTVTVANRKVVKIVPFASGSGYTSVPTVAFSGGGGTGAAASAVVSGGKVVSFSITNQGSGYTSAPTITLTGGGGSGAYGTPVIEGGTVTGNAKYPQQDLIGIRSAPGDGGYSTFGPLLTAIAATPQANQYFVTYVADADAESALAAGAKELSWNGVFLGNLGTSGAGTASPALANGQYSLWGYIRLAYRFSLAGTQLATEQAIANQLRTADSQVLLSDVQVNRQSDGGQIFQGPYVAP